MQVDITLKGSPFCTTDINHLEVETLRGAIVKRAKDDPKMKNLDNIQFLISRSKETPSGYIYCGVAVVTEKEVCFVEIHRDFNTTSNWNDSPPEIKVTQWLTVSIVEVWKYAFSAFCMSVTTGYCFTEEDCLTVKNGLHFTATEDYSYVVKIKAIMIGENIYELNPISITKPSPAQPSG